jgi:hypothetical protein
MQRSNFVGEVRAGLALPVVAGIIVCSFAVTSSASAREHHAARVHYGHHFAGHHLLPATLEASNSFGGSGSATDGMAAAQASAAGVPLSLVQRVIARESGGNPRAVSRGNYGLMQIRLGTARAMGYTGSAAGLLDPQTNMTYAVRYLAGAYRAAGGNENRAVALYARGYYAEAKARGFSPYATTATAAPVFTPVSFTTAEATTIGTPWGATPVYRVRRLRHHAT